MSNIEKYPKCYMRTSLGNCDPIGGFCTSVKTDICEALHKAAEPRTGEWSCDEYALYHCSECGCEATWDYDYCPNCGADMRGGEDE